MPQIPANILLVKNLVGPRHLLGLLPAHQPELLPGAFAQMFDWWREGKLEAARLAPLRSGRGQGRASRQLVERKATGKVVLTMGRLSIERDDRVACARSTRPIPIRRAIPHEEKRR